MLQQITDFLGMQDIQTMVLTLAITGALVVYSITEFTNVHKPK